MIDDSAGVYRLRNNGNTVVLIDEFRNCSLKIETECEPTTKHHILAGKTFEFEKKSPVANTASTWWKAHRKKGAAHRQPVIPAGASRLGGLAVFF